GQTTMRQPYYWLLCPVALVTQAAGADWSGLHIVPQDISLARAGDSQHFSVLARSADGQEEDVTSQCHISSSDSEVAAVDPARRVLTGKRRGQSEIRAQIGTLHAATSVKVGDRASDVAVRFSPDVISVLTIKGCNSSGCHGSPAGQNGFKLSLFGYDVAADQEMIANKHNGRRVDLTRAENSLLLKKPLFEIPHGGGRLMTRESEEYRTLL